MKNFEGVVFRGETANEKKLPEVKEALRFLEDSLQKQNYVAADHVTIAGNKRFVVCKT